MKKLILTILLLSISLFANNDIIVKTIDNNQHTQKKVVNIAFGFHKPPFVFGRNMIKGIEPDLIKESFNLMGYKVHSIKMSKNLLETILLEKNNIDGVSTITPHNPKLFYSDDFTTYENYAITRKIDHFNIQSIDDLKYLNFVAWNGAYNDLGNKFYKLYNPINGRYKKSYHSTIKQSDDVKLFFSGKVDAILCDKTIFSWYKNLYKNYEQYQFHPIFPKKKI